MSSCGHAVSPGKSVIKGWAGGCGLGLGMGDLCRLHRWKGPLALGYGVHWGWLGKVGIRISLPSDRGKGASPWGLDWELAGQRDRAGGWTMAVAQRVAGSGSLYFRASPGQCPRLACMPEHRVRGVCVGLVGWGVVGGCLRCRITGPLGEAKQRVDRVLRAQSC